MTFQAASLGVFAAAARRPDAPAILTAGAVGRTYGELVRDALAIGGALRARGIGPEQVVAVDLPKSGDLVTALLGVWAAGAAFSVLDPALPAARRREAATRCGARWRIVRPAGPSAGAASPEVAAGSATPLPLDAALAGARLERPHTPAPGDLAYVCWTSGSTGSPKGVAVEHLGLASVLTQQVERFALRPGDRALWLLRPGFDASLSDVFVALLAGAVLCVEPDLAPPLDPRVLAERLGRRRIQLVDLPPALLPRLDAAAAPAALETIVVGGEVADPAAVRRWAPRVRLLSVYGPTEATICTSVARCGSDWDRPLLGEPLAGVRYRLLGPAGEDAGDGPGELTIGGAQVARGYVGRRDEEALRFFEQDGVRWYRTGDRARRDPDGAWVFLGRVDRQVKVRGQRVAPEQVEVALAALPGVGRAHVLCLPARPGGPGALTAFVAPSSALPDAAPDPDALRAALARTLAPWELPQRWILLPRLPETSSGKVDGAALAALARSGAVASASTPQSAAEAALLAAAAGVLAGEVDLERGFVSQGGDSLTALDVALAAERAGHPVAVHDLVADVPLRALAARGPTSPAAAAAALEARAALPPDVAAAAADAVAAARADAAASGSWLLTGATGLLGSRLLPELLARAPASRVTCLVRGGDGPARLQAACDRHRPGWFEAQGSRVEVVRGDVARPGLGLAAADHERLADEVGAVLHAAAWVNLALPYAALAGVNVGGVAEVLRFCLAGRPKALHYASTLSVFVATDRDRGVAREADDLGATGEVYGGYAQTKWVAERLVRRVPAGALPSTVYRLGLLTGDARAGLGPEGDLLARVTRGLATLGAVPAPWLDRLSFDVTPASFAAAALAALATAGGAARRATFHVAGATGLSLRAWVEALRAEGAVIEAVDPEAFERRAARGGTDVAAAVLALSRGAGRGRHARHRPFDGFPLGELTIDCSRTDEALARAGLARPAPTAAQVRRYARAILRGAPRAPAP